MIVWVLEMLLIDEVFQRRDDDLPCAPLFQLALR